jgi:hypothetical protein
VGGTLIARSGGGGPVSSALFLGGFLCAGLLWSAGLCFAASHGGKLLGDKLLRYSYMASAAIFCYFAVYVIVSGYNEFVGSGAADQLHACDIANRVWLLYSAAEPLFCSRSRVMDEQKRVEVAEPRFEHGHFLLIAGFRGRFTQDTAKDIPALWEKFLPHLGKIQGQKTK